MPLKFACIHFLDVFTTLQATLVQYYRFCVYEMFIKSTNSSLKDSFAKPTRMKPICKDEISIVL